MIACLSRRKTCLFGARSALSVLVGLAFALWLFPGRAAAQPSGPMPTNVGFDARFGARAPLEARLFDEEGRAVTLGDYVRGERPVVVVMAYFECPMLCSMVLQGITTALRRTELTPGRDFELVVISIDPRDTPERAGAKKAVYAPMLRHPAAGGAIHFLTGEEAETREVAVGIGFRYEWDPVGQQFAHAGGAVVLTPDGTISRYFHGVDFAPRDLRLGLVDAAGGKIGTTGDRLLLLCYRYDPVKGKYGALALGSVRAGGVITVLFLAIGLYAMRKRGALGAGEPGSGEPRRGREGER